jgi:predicted ATPase/predicted Ser/Thr protein kinase
MTPSDSSPDPRKPKPLPDGTVAGVGWSPESDAPPPDSIGPYRVVGELGRGGMGVVYEGEDTRLRRHIAIKVLPDTLAADAVALARFEREAQLLAALNHPNIATIHSLEEDGEARFLTMEYVPGDTLGGRLERSPLERQELLTICRQIATALEAAHEKGVVHRDLKPLNIKITPDGLVKVLDFGLAKALQAADDRPVEAEPPDDATLAGGDTALDLDATLAGGGIAPDPDANLAGGAPDLDATLAGGSPAPDPDATIAPGRPVAEEAETFAGTTMKGEVLGTPGYMSPEQLRAGTVDHRCDIWAFGCILFECLSRRRIFRAETLRATIRATLERDVDWSKLPEDTPGPLRDLLEQCLTVDPAHRLNDISRARRMLEDELMHLTMPSALTLPKKRETQKPNNLPLNLPSFIGRETAQREVKELLRERRLVTLTGAGGSGKTRLALEVAWDLVDGFQDGVWRVELAPLADPALITQTVATVFGLQETANRELLDTLREHLAEKSAMIVLDNCEHLLEACSELTAAFLAACPSLQVLATSHEGLGVDDEAVFRVPLLSLPADAERATPEKLLRTEAVRLFMERARAVRPDLELTADNAPAVVQVCRRLDGIPLALELAAARAKVLPVEDIAKRLDQRFRLLTTGDQASVPRHQTLRAMIDWSYDNLEGPAQALLRRLSVFAGGWTMDATEAVCSGDTIEDWEVLDLLTQLVDKSLAQLDADASQGTDHVRYRMLETVRLYARDKLEETGETGEARSRHRRFFLGLAEEAEPQLTSEDQAKWLLRLAADHDNFRTALSRVADAGPEEIERSLAMAGALGRYWSVRGHWSEGRRLCTELATAPGQPTSARAKVLHWAGNLAYRQGDYEPARKLHRQALAVRRGLGDRSGVAASLDSLAVVAHDQGEYARSRERFEEALAIRRELGDQWAIAQSLNNLGVAIENEGDYERSRACHTEALGLRRELGEPWGVAGSLSNLGCALERLGELDHARECHEEALGIRRGLGDPWGIGISLKNLALVLYRQGDDDGARPLYEESLRVFREIEERYEMTQALTGLGWVALREGNRDESRALQEESLRIRRDLGEQRGLASSLEAIAALEAAEERWAKAARLAGAAEVLRERMRTPRSTLEAAELAEALAPVRAALGDDYERERQAGRALSTESAADQALGVQPAATPRRPDPGLELRR